MTELKLQIAYTGKIANTPVGDVVQTAGPELSAPHSFSSVPPTHVISARKGKCIPSPTACANGM